MRTDRMLVAGQYAQAVLELALAISKDTEAFVLRDLKLANQYIEISSELAVILNHPGIPLAEKKNILAILFKGKVVELTQRLLELLCDKRKLDLLPQIEQEYQRLFRLRENIVVGTIVCADKLDKASLEQIKEKLRTNLSQASIELTEVVDKSLIGGYVLRLGDNVIDGSIKGRLQAMERTLSRV